MVGVGWGAPFGSDLGWDWWPFVGFVILFGALLLRTRIHPAGALGIAVVGGTALSSMTHAFGVAIVWFPLMIVLTTVPPSKRRPD